VDFKENKKAVPNLKVGNGFFDGWLADPVSLDQRVFSFRGLRSVHFPGSIRIRDCSPFKIWKEARGKTCMAADYPGASSLAPLLLKSSSPDPVSSFPLPLTEPARPYVQKKGVTA
jgi:hypothetical protein